MKKWMKIGAFACAGVMAMSMSAFADTAADTSNTAEAAKIPDGVYSISAVTDSSMFRIKDEDNNTAVLTVKNGTETVSLRLDASGFEKMYIGTSDVNPENNVNGQIKYQLKRGDSYYFTLPLSEDNYSLKTGTTVVPVKAWSPKRRTWYPHTITFTYTGNEQNLETAKVTAPAKTSIKKLTAKKKAAAVSWKRITENGSGYQLQYSTSKSMKKASTSNLYYNDETSKTVKKLKSGKTYYFRVRTEHFNGYKSAYSGWSKVKSVKVK
ncbi:MAG: fibronectin type III domain-containing protein [Eubacterium sp.]